MNEIIALTEQSASAAKLLNNWSGDGCVYFGIEDHRFHEVQSRAAVLKTVDHGFGALVGNLKAHSDDLCAGLFNDVARILDHAQYLCMLKVLFQRGLMREPGVFHD